MKTANELLLNRRVFLRASALTVGVAAIAACTPVPTQVGPEGTEPEEEGAQPAADEVVLLEKMTGSLGVALPAPENDPINRGILEAINVDFRHIDVPADQLPSLLAVRIAGGDPPDIMSMPIRASSWIGVPISVSSRPPSSTSAARRCSGWAWWTKPSTAFPGAWA
jgi:ABC-type glycerol-3-phosphate transport system substrate-binding protein